MAGRGTLRLGVLLFALALPVSAVRAQEPAAPALDAGIGPAVQAPAEVVVEIRIHGNWATPDDEVVRLAGLTVGQPLGPGTLDASARRLRDSGRFDGVEIRRRYRSLTDARQVVLVVVVVERAGRENGPGFIKPVQKVTGRILFFPVLDYTDGYGFTYGARTSFVDLLGERGRVSVPLTWGGTRRAAVELDKGWAGGPFDRLAAGAAISQRENPHYELDDRRTETWVGVGRGLRGRARLEFRAGLTDVEFGAFDDTFASYRVGAVLDTRTSPTFPRNAVLARAAWELADVRGGPAPNRVEAAAAGYLGLPGQIVLSAQARYEGADRPLPPYLKPLVGGAGSLRGFPAGAFAGDNLAAGSLEVRRPFTSVMSVARTGLTLFTDVAAAYDRGTGLRDARFHQGVGCGFFVAAPIVQINLDVAYGLGRGWRAHFTTGFTF